MRSIALLTMVLGLLLPQWSVGQPAVWEQKLDLHASCTPDAIVEILAIAAGEDGTVYASDQSHLLDASGRVWIGTLDGAVFRTSESTVIVSNEPGAIGLDASSLEVFPNPSAGVVTIAVTRSSSGHSRLEIYDSLGRLVETLHSGFLTPGPHSFQWHGAVATNGWYFVRHASETTIQQEAVVRVAH